MSKGVITVPEKKDQLLVEFERLLEQQIAAARADDFSTVGKLADGFTKRAAAIGAMITVSDHKQKLEKLHRQLECILTDKLAVTEQQLSNVQKTKKLLGVYRP